MSSSCIVHINSTFNNTIMTATNLSKQTIIVKSLGNVLKAKRGKKSVAHGALLTGEILGKFLIGRNFNSCQVRLKGFGSGRESSVQGLVSSGLIVTDIFDVTKIPHNGCRPPKKRRI